MPPPPPTQYNLKVKNGFLTRARGTSLGVVALAFMVIFAGAIPAVAQQNHTGDGGSGMSIAITAPRAVGLSASLEYLTFLIHSELVSNFAEFSGMRVLDLLNYDEQMSELMDNKFADSARENLRIGNLSHTDYLMDGTITRAATGYNLQVRILRTSDQATVALYSGTSATIQEFDNLIPARRASLDLLPKMGVTLTSQARNTLGRAPPANRVRGQKADAQGRAAQSRGMVVTALSYYHQAAAFDSSRVDAIGRSEIITAEIASGRTRNTIIDLPRPNFERSRPNLERTQTSNIGENVRNEIQRHRDSIAYEIAWHRDSVAAVNAWRRDSTAIANAWIRDSTERDNTWRRDWLAQLRETEEVFHNIITSAEPPYILHYSTDIHTSNINYQAETADLSIFARVEANEEWFNAMQQALRTVRSVMTGLNATGRKYDWGLGRWPERGVSNNNPFIRTWTHDIKVVFELVDERGRVIGRQRTEFNPYFGISQYFVITTPRNIDRAITFNGVKADDISDQLTIRVARVNRRSPENAQISINVMTDESEHAITKRERDRVIENSLAEAARLKAQGQEWWALWRLGAGGAFLLGNVDSVYYSGGALTLFAADLEFFRWRSRAIRFGGGFDIGFLGFDKDAIKEEHPNVHGNSIDSIGVSGAMFRMGAYLKLHPVNFFYLSGGIGYGWYGGYSGRGDLDIKGGNSRSAPIVSVGGGITFNRLRTRSDYNYGFFIDAQHHLLQDNDRNDGYWQIKAGVDIAVPISGSDGR